MRGLTGALPALALCLALSSRASAGEDAVCASGGFTVDDYFDVRRVGDLAMSGDGELLVYAVDSHSGGTRSRSVHLLELPGDGPGRAVGGLSGARDFAWIPGAHELAFLSQEDGVTQVFSWRAVDGETRPLTRSADAVESFRFASDGSALAFTSRAESEPGVSLYDRFRNGTEGIRIDPATTSSHDFLNPHWHPLAKAPPLALWVQRAGEAIKVPVPGEPADSEEAFSWSTDGRRLSVTFVAADVPASPMREERTSVGVFELATGDFRVIAAGVQASDGQPAIHYRGGEWIPGEERVLVRRVTETDPWVSDSFPDWTVADASLPLTEQRLAWRPVETYPRGLRFMPLSASEILLTNTVRGVHSLFTLTPNGIERSAIVKRLDGSSSLFRFSAGYGDVAFVNESLLRPPEIYVSRNGKPARRVTELNAEIAERLAWSRREVRWQSTDGTEVSGWLLEPDGSRPATGWPTVTHVHGGPAFPFPDAFAPYFAYWPYPLEIYPAHGIAVFLPNYRGTHTYGRRIATSGADEPIEDIVSGVQYLVSGNVADPSRLGISGHSHGALVGPLAMVRSGLFAAGSFAEGVGNSVVMYELMSGDANREIHDATMGGSLYEAPELYLEQSADLRMEGVRTASLFEAGAYMTALYMLGLAKAADRFGVPFEFIVYPQTGHNIAIPALQRESAERNVAWFDFWLDGCAPADPAHAAWRRRWQALGTAGT